MSFGQGPSFGVGTGAFFGHGTPGPLGTLALATGTAGTLSGRLGADPSQLGRLIQAVVRVAGNLGTETEAEAGPVWAELWLNRQNALSLLLDKGFVAAGGARGKTAVVGIVGSLSVSLGDSLTLRAANDSGATVTLVLEAAVAPADPSTADALTALSTEPTAIYTGSGTVTLDATAGTHVASLTLTVAAGDHLVIRYGRITVGNTATAQTATARVLQASGVMTWLLNPQLVSNTLANEVYVFPQAGQNTAALIGTDIDFMGPVSEIEVDGPGTVILDVTTTQVSIAEGFAIVCRVRGRAPTLALADTIGVPVTLIVTNQVQ